MSGLVGHSLYAILGLKAAEQRRLPLAAVARRYFASYLAGAYLGSDIQTMPEAVCIDTGRECGYGTVPVERSPFTGGAVRPFTLETPSGPTTPREVHRRFYGRAHLIFGWDRADLELAVPWDHLPDYLAAVIDDAELISGVGLRPVAYMLGWIVHIVSDSLIKSKQPGLTLNLIDGLYTPRNRPIQDLFEFHKIGKEELRLNWPAIFQDLSETPVENLQLHAMRCSQPRGKLASLFSDGWAASQSKTLHAILVENRRWLPYHISDILVDTRLEDGECSEPIRRLVGMPYDGMMHAAEVAGIRGMLAQLTEAIADMFVAVEQRSTLLASLPADDPDWGTLRQSWKVKK